MRKKIVSIILVAVMLISMACVGAISTSAADTKGTIYLQFPQDWIDKYGDSAKATVVYAHIWVNGGEENTEWQTKNEKMTRVGEGLWAYELTSLPAALEDGTQPQWDMVIFSVAAASTDENGNRITIGEQTYDTTLYPECIGKTFTIDTSVTLENPMDSSKKGAIAYCEGTPAGPHLVLSSLGNVVPSGDEVRADGSKVTGSLLPSESVDQVVANFVSNKVTAFVKANPNATEAEIAAEEAVWTQYAVDNDLKGKVEAALGVEPTEAPTEEPTEAPTEEPTEAPTEEPTEAPTEEPTDAPTAAPTDAPTEEPTDAPTAAPTDAPTDEPTDEPTDAPTEEPTDAPTDAPTEEPTDAPTAAPTDAPTAAPTDAPTEAPTEEPTDEPTEEPTEAPTEESTVDEYGRYRGIPMPDGMIINQEKQSDPDDPDWDGYYRIYYFEAPDSWFENADYKDEGYEIGFYWYKGETSNGAWPGEPAKSLADWKIDYFKTMNPQATEEEIAAETAKIEELYGNVYYGICKSNIPFILWNNGINGGLPTDADFNLDKANAARQTEDINVEDSFYNELGDGYGVTDLCGCITEVTGETSQVNGLTGITQTLATVTWHYYDPKTGAKTDEGLKDENGDYIFQDVDGIEEAMNPYYDMDYSYIPPQGTPVEVPTGDPSTLPEEDPTNGNNGTTNPTEGGKAGGSTTTTNNTSNNSAKGTVNTAENTESSAILAIVAVLLVAGLGVAVVSRKRKMSEEK